MMDRQRDRPDLARHVLRAAPHEMGAHRPDHGGNDHQCSERCSATREQEHASGYVYRSDHDMEPYRIMPSAECDRPAAVIRSPDDIRCS